MRIVPAATLPLSRWTNGAGRKADILVGEGWLIGFAWLDADAPFSRLPGMDRTITLVEGPGFALHGGDEPLAVPTPFQPARFDGGTALECRIAGPCRVLNAMTDRARFRHEVTIGTQPGAADPRHALATVIVALAGDIVVGADRLGRLDAAVIDTPTEIGLSPGGRFACIAIRNAR